jgi:predicted transcriptional regulator
MGIFSPRKPLILMSLKPGFWQPMLDRKKRFEYRRNFCKLPVNAYVYLSSPQQEIAGYIEFGPPIIDTPANLSKIAEEDIPGFGKLIDEYLEGKTTAFAAPIITCQSIPPIPLAQLRKEFNFRPPQSYLMLDNFPPLRDFIKNNH